MYSLALLFLLLMFVASGVVYAADKEVDARPGTVYTFSAKNIDGHDVDLGSYKGKVLLIVNTASRCGYTPQYEQIEKVFRKYKDQGLAVLAFPANDFGKQEPGSDAEIKEFCTTRFDASFDLFSKISVVKGENQHPLYAWLTTDKQYGGPVKWNFTKFLIGRDGRVVGRFESKVKPDSDEAVKAIEAALKKQD